MKKLFISFFLICNFFGFSNENVEGISNPILEKLMYKVRDPQTEKKEFRKSLEKIGEYLALDLSKNFKTSTKTIKTSLNITADHQILDEDVVVLTVLRAGLPFFYGIIKIFDEAEVGFFAMRRNEESLIAAVDYIALPPLKDKIVIVSDTMIATGGSLISVLKTIKKYKPTKIIVLGVIVAKAAIEKIHEYDPEIEIYAAAIDPLLNDKGYILPRLGDAGDRCYGTKHH